MTLVAVIDILLDAEFLQQQHTTDTKQDLLLQAVLPVTTIQGVGDGLVELRVHLIVGVEQIQLHTAYIHTPDVSIDMVVHIGDIDYQRIAVLVELEPRS